jgi:peptide/nickel transport system ATP-binding protein
VPVLEVESLVTELRVDGRYVPVVDNVSFTLDAGETLAVVGESGCGKSMMAMSLLKILPERIARIASGRIMLEGQDMVQASVREARSMRGKKMAIIFQDPMASLNPVETIGNQIIEMLREHEDLSRKEARARAIELLRTVRLPDAEKRVDEYPHRLSGGMCQRVMIAMALACRPKVLVADEPNTALDVTIQAQILGLLANLRAETGTAVILITHNLAIVAQTADRLLVMYAGEVMEAGDVEEIFRHPRHPYTRQLIAAIPGASDVSDGEIGKLAEIRGSVLPIDERGVGCSFAPRCDRAVARCSAERPALLHVTDAHSVACFAAHTQPRAV